MLGLLGFYQLLFLVYVFGGYFFLYRLWEGISKGGPLNSVRLTVSFRISEYYFHILTAYLILLRLTNMNQMI